MQRVRSQMRYLIISFILLGLVYISADNYIRLEMSPWDMLVSGPAAFFVLWGGCALIGFVLDRLAGFGLRRFLRALHAMETGAPISLQERQAAAVVGIRFPGTAAAWLLALAALFTLIFHQTDATDGLLLALQDPEIRTDLVNLMLREMLLALALAVLFFSAGRRILRQGLVRLNVPDLPGVSSPSVQERFVVLVAAQSVMFVSLFLTTPPDVSQLRMVSGYLLLGSLGALIAYLLASEVRTAIDTVSIRLRQLSAEIRPNRFARVAVVADGEVANLISAINALQDRAERELAILEQDLADARSLQRALLPRTPVLPVGWDLAVRLMPAREVGGDFYDLIPLGGRQLGVAVGDVAGKGLPSALLMAYTVSLLRSYAPQYQSPGAVLGAVNRLLATVLPPRVFVTVVYCVVDLDTRAVVAATAGHFSPVIGRRKVAPVSSLPLGVDPDVAYQEQRFVLEPEEPFLLFSDGLVEAVNLQGTVLGTDPVEALLARVQPGRSAESVMDELLSLMEDHQDGQPVADDVTALLLLPPAEIQREFPSQDGSDLEAAELAEAFARPVLGAERAREVATAVGEACRNAIIHGNREHPQLPFAVRLQAGAGVLQARVCDHGSPFALPESAPDLTQQMDGDAPFRGWGIPLMRALSDDLRVEPASAGKQVVLTFYAPGGGRTV